MAIIQFQNVQRVFHQNGKDFVALQDINLEVRDREFVAIVGQGGSNGVIQAMKDAGHPWVPVAGESENGFRKAIAENKDAGLKGISIGQSPGLVAVAMKAGATKAVFDSTIGIHPTMAEEFVTMREAVKR